MLSVEKINELTTRGLDDANAPEGTLKGNDGGIAQPGEGDPRPKSQQSQPRFVKFN